MQLPIVSVAPIVKEQAEIYRDVFANQKQYRHFQNYVTGLIVLENKSMANIARCVLESADKTNLSRYLSEAPWREERLNDKQVSHMQEQTRVYRVKAAESVLPIDDTLCEHVGSLFEYVDRHYNHGNQQYPLAHNLVTSHSVSGPVRFPVDARLYRRYEEFTEWELFVEKYFPDETIPKKTKERQKFHTRIDPKLLEDPQFRKLSETFETKISLASQVVQKAVERGLAFDWVLFDYQDSKQLLGLDEYHMRTAQAFQKHWSLVFVAFSLLHLDCLAASLPQKQSSPIKSIGEAARQQTQFLIQELILFAHHAIQSGDSAQQVFVTLFAKQQPSPT